MPWLGWVALLVAGVAVLALVVIAAREIFGLLRLATVERLRNGAMGAIAADDKDAALDVGRELAFACQAATRLPEHAAAAELFQAAERELMARCDQTARALVPARLGGATSSASQSRHPLVPISI